MQKKSKILSITMHAAIVKSITNFIYEMKERDANKYISIVFAYINEEDQRTRVIDISTQEKVSATVKEGFKLKAQFVIFTIWNPSINEDVQTLDIIAYSKKGEMTANKSPFRIVNNKIIPVEKQEKGFHVFMED